MGSLGMMGRFCCLSRSEGFGKLKRFDVPARGYGHEDAGKFSIYFHHSSRRLSNTLN